MELKTILVLSVFSVLSFLITTFVFRRLVLLFKMLLYIIMRAEIDDYVGGRIAEYLTWGNVFLLIQALLNIVLNVLSCIFISQVLMWLLFLNINFCFIGTVLSVWFPLAGLKRIIPVSENSKADDFVGRQFSYLNNRSKESFLSSVLRCLMCEREFAISKIKNILRSYKDFRKDSKIFFKSFLNVHISIQQAILYIFVFLYIISYASIVRVGVESRVLIFAGISNSSFLDSIYFVLTMFSTIGFGDIHPHVDSDKAKFVTVVFIAGILILALLVINFFHNIVSARYKTAIAPLKNVFNYQMDTGKLFISILKKDELKEKFRYLEGRFKTEENKVIFEEIYKHISKDTQE